MADQVDYMSDPELRRKLTEHGCTDMPITPPTRKLWEKKLQQILGNKLNPLNDIGSDKNRRKEVSMADQEDYISDSELRRKLTEHGCTDLPITASTRKLWVEKLQQILDQKIRDENQRMASQRPSITSTAPQGAAAPRLGSPEVDNMSDVELRAKLAQHGFPDTPITATTRNLLLKKLKQGLSNKIRQRTKPAKIVKVDRKRGQKRKNNVLERKNTELTNNDNNLEIRLDILEKRIKELEQEKLCKSLEVPNLPAGSHEETNKVLKNTTKINGTKELRVLRNRK